MVMLHGMYEWKDQSLCLGDVGVTLSFSNPGGGVRDTGRCVWWDSRVILREGQEELCVISMDVMENAQKLYSLYNASCHDLL